MFDSAKNPISRYDNYSSHVVLNRGSDHGVETDDSGESTPPLWRTSPNRPLLRPNQYRGLAPEAKTQAILKGQMELMEMVGRMPESSYELSLKDLVEYPLRQDNFMEEQRVNIDHEISTRRREQEVLRRKKNNENKLQMMKRIGSIENRGFLLNMSFPVSSWGSGKKKENLNSMDSKVLPKPGVAEGVGEKEWWKKRYVVSAGESESVGLSSNSASSKSSGSSSSRSSSSRSSGRHEAGGCWALIFTKQGKMRD